MTDRSGKWSLFPGIFLISLTSLSFEITLTRIFSVAYGSHFAYFVISIALLGYAAAGSFMHLFPSLPEKNYEKLIIKGSVLFPESLLLSFLLVNSIPFEPYEIIWDRKQILFMLAVFLTLSLPFFFSGLTILSAVYHRSGETGKIYFSDLAGAGTGCFVPLLLFSFMDGGKVIPAIAAFSILSFLFFAIYIKLKNRLYYMPLLILIISLPLMLPGRFDVHISPYRDLKRALGYDEARILSTQWDAVSRTDTLLSPAVRFAPGLSIKYTDELPKQTGITVDGGNLQALTDIESGRMDFIEHLPSSLPYLLRSPGNVFVCSFGGGLDIIAAKYFGAGIIYASDKNPATADIFTDHYQGILDFSKIRIYKTEGRNLLRTSDIEFDHVVISLNETLGASAGAFSFGEDYLFTVEAFAEYYNSLKDGGFISVTRYLRPILMQDEKLLRMIKASLPGAADTLDNVISIRSIGTITTIIKKGRINDEEISLTRDFCEKNRFDSVYYPGMDQNEANRYNRFPEPIYHNLYIDVLREDREISEKKPVSDDAPFFDWIPSYGRLKEMDLDVLVNAGFLVPLTAGGSLILSFILLFLPVVIKKRRGVKPKKGAGITAVLFFASIGAAYMFTEIPLIHRMLLYLGNPVYSIAAVLSSMLISSGLGSLYAAARIKDERKGIMAALLLLSVILILYSLLLSRFIYAFMGLPMIPKLTLLTALIFPAGFLMGMPFPLGIALLGKKTKELIPLAWCANGCSSVVGASFAVAAVVTAGYSALIACAAAMYAISFICISLYFHFIASPVIGTKATDIR